MKHMHVLNDIIFCDSLYKCKFKFYYHRHCYNTLTIVLNFLTAYVYIIIVLDHQGVLLVWMV